MEVKIVAISKEDGFYMDRKKFIGKIGTITEKQYEFGYEGNGWYGGEIKFKKPIIRTTSSFYFYLIKIKKI